MSAFPCRRDASDLVFQVHGVRCTARSHVIGVTGRERVAVELRGFVRFAQSCKDGERGTGAKIGAEADAHRTLLLRGALNVEVAAAEEEVGRRAMRDGRTGPVHHVDLIVGQMDAVAECARPAQRVVIQTSRSSLRSERSLPKRPGPCPPTHASACSTGVLLAERATHFQSLARAR